MHRRLASLPARLALRTRATRRLLVSLLVSAVGVTTAARAHGEGASDRVHLVLPAEAGCDAAVFSSALDRRVTALDPAWRDLRLEAQVARRGAQIEGRVWATSKHGAGAARTVVGSTCEQTLRSLALLAAIALDAASRERQEREAAARAAPPTTEPSPSAEGEAAPAPPPPPPPAAPPAPEPAAAVVDAPPIVQERPKRVDAADGSAPHADEARRGWRPLAGASVEVSSLGVFGAPFVGVERRRGPWPLALEVGAVLGGGDVDPNIPEMHTHSSRRLGRIQACPWQLELTSRIHVRPCLAVDVGAVQTELVNPQAPPPGEPAGPSTAPRSDAWVAARLGLRLGVDVLSWLRVEADAAMAAGSSAPEWVFQRGFVMQQPGPIVALAGGAAVHFP